MLSSRPLSIHGDASMQAMHTKTPGRGLNGRHALQENFLQRGAMTGKVKGKQGNTPFRPAIQGQKAVREGKTPAIVLRPLLDKTPAPNRVNNTVPFKTPAPETAKLVKLSLLEQATSITAGALLRPSSTRKSVRARTSTSVPQHFQTPVTQGNHWDVSDGDVSIGGPETEVERRERAEEDYDEIEYMPPTAIDFPYQPPFDMPDYKSLGKLVFNCMHSESFDGPPSPIAHDLESLFTSDSLLDETGLGHFERLKLLELDGDSIFSRRLDLSPAQSRSKPATQNATAQSIIPSRSVPASRPTSHQAAAGPSRVSTKTSTSTPTIVRPATSAPSSGMSRLTRPAISTASANASIKPLAAPDTGAMTQRAVAPSSRPTPALAKAKASVYGTTPGATTLRAPLSKTGSSMTAATRITPVARGATTSRLRMASTVVRARSTPSKVQLKANDVALDFIIDAEGLGEDFKFDV